MNDRVENVFIWAFYFFAIARKKIVKRTLLSFCISVEL